MKRKHRKLAKKAGFIFWRNNESWGPGAGFIDWGVDYGREMDRFVKLLTKKRKLKKRA